MWTLRDFHNQGGANNFKPPQPVVHDTPLNPPPVPARRLASQPPVPTHHGQPQPPLPAIRSPEKTSESHSAPSSPTGEAKRLVVPTDTSPVSSRSSSALNASPRTSPTSRPRSMMVDMSSQELGYSTVQFTDSLNQKPFKAQRRDTKYSEIVHPPTPATLEAPEAPKPIPRTRSLDRKQDPKLVPCGAEGSPPPSKVYPEMTSGDDPFLNTEALGDPFAHNPFDNDPFADDNADDWRDSTAFYDHPPPPRPYTAGMEVPKKSPSPEPVPDDLKFDGETADCTDESAYQDTKDFLEGVQAKHRGEEFQVSNDNPRLSADLYMPDMSEPPQSVPEPVAKHSPTSKQSSSGTYEYPTILDKYQKRSEDSKPSDEPPLHSLTYSKLAPSAPGNLTRSESLRASGRRAMPLPPLPDDKDQPPLPLPPPAAAIVHPIRLSPPPLPARPMGPPQPGYPSLPPLNHPWGNKKARSEELPANPPLPPRRKEPAPVYNGGNEPPKPSAGTPETNSSVPELLALGYTLSEIERALIISKNDITLAKLILKEFGGR